MGGKKEITQDFINNMSDGKMIAWQKNSKGLIYLFTCAHRHLHAEIYMIL